MNVNMWEHAATQENVAKLRARGVHIVEPGAGYLACGMTGPGRMAETEEVARAVCELLGIRHDYRGKTVLVTAGPTREDIDPVRFLTNRSSGKMGYAVADAAARRGARVILISGPVELAPPDGAEIIHVRTAEGMHRATLEHAPQASIVVMAAAVADYRVAAPAAEKLKRAAGRVSLELEPTPDILSALARVKGNQILVGFAAETSNLEENAAAKLERKNADIIVANDVTQQGAGFDVDTNIVTLLFRDGHRLPLPQMSKLAVANRLLDEILSL
jgi:phosphopantothenoylcysteine decarboxylase/phosphopantothenate--cysteine ligase